VREGVDEEAGLFKRLFKANAVNEVDAERDRATPSGRRDPPINSYRSRRREGQHTVMLCHLMGDE
jgi:hypothetical protein